MPRLASSPTFVLMAVLILTKALYTSAPGAANAQSELPPLELKVGDIADVGMAGRQRLLQNLEGALVERLSLGGESGGAVSGNVAMRRSAGSGEMTRHPRDGSHGVVVGSHACSASKRKPSRRASAEPLPSPQPFPPRWPSLRSCAPALAASWLQCAVLTVARGHENPFGTEGMFARRFIVDDRKRARKLNTRPTERLLPRHLPFTATSPIPVRTRPF